MRRALERALSELCARLIHYDLNEHLPRTSLEQALFDLYEKHSFELKPDEPVLIRVPGGHLFVELFPDEHSSDNEVNELSTCERDCLEVLRSAGRKMTAKEILTEFAEHSVIWGKSTVCNALATLRDRGLIKNANDKRGYAIADSD